MSNPKQIIELHEMAMNKADDAFFLAREKDHDPNKVIALYTEAFQLEKQGAMTLEDRADCEPTRSVLFRSAGSLALMANLKSDAQEMVSQGLKYCIHEDIKQELEELKKDSQ